MSKRFCVYKFFTNCLNINLFQKKTIVDRVFLKRLIFKFFLKNGSEKGKVDLNNISII